MYFFLGFERFRDLPFSRPVRCTPISVLLCLFIRPGVVRNPALCRFAISHFLNRYLALIQTTKTQLIWSCSRNIDRVCANLLIRFTKRNLNCLQLGTVHYMTEVYREPSSDQLFDQTPCLLRTPLRRLSTMYIIPFERVVAIFRQTFIEQVQFSCDVILVVLQRFCRDSAEMGLVWTVN